MALLVAAVLVSSSADAQDSADTPQDRPAPSGTAETDLGVSLDNIRDGLRTPPPRPLLGLDRQVNFRIEIQQKMRLEEMFKALDFKPGPVPAGGIYAYEQQRRLFNPVSHPLMQPYAAFSGGELIVVAIQNLLGRYVGKPAIESLKDANRARAVRAARQVVDQDIETYCAAQPNRWEILLCNPNR